MSNRFKIPEKTIESLRKRDKKCVYCRKSMKEHTKDVFRGDWWTIEHLNFDGPFYWNKGLKEQDLVICCWSCNSSRGKLSFPEWFKKSYCKKCNIDKNKVAEPVKKYLRNKK